MQVALVAALSGVLFGCAGDAVTPPEPLADPSSLYWRLTLNQRAINLSTAAPYDTFRLVAIPRRVDGTPLEALGAPRFISTDPDRLQVSPDGLLRGLGATMRVRVLVTLTEGQITHTDTALVSVTTDSTPPVLAQLALEAAPPDSAKYSLQANRIYFPFDANIVPHAFDTEGNEISGLAVWIVSSDPKIAIYNNDNRRMLLRYPGHVTFYASTVVNGVSRADTLEYRVGLPVNAGFTPIAEPTGVGGALRYRFRPANVITIAAGGYVFWTHPRALPPFDVTFDDPTNVAADEIWCERRGGCTGSGNIPTFGDASNVSARNFVTRHFPVPGTYIFRSAALNISGAIIVVDESQGQ